MLLKQQFQQMRMTTIMKRLQLLMKQPRLSIYLQLLRKTLQRICMIHLQNLMNVLELSSDVSEKKSMLLRLPLMLLSQMKKQAAAVVVDLLLLLHLHLLPLLRLLLLSLLLLP